MKRSSTLFLKVVLLLMAVVVTIVMLVFPQHEGRNIGADFAHTYLNDPFLWYLYLGTIPFFAALYQSFKLLGLIERNEAFTQAAVDRLRNITRCAVVIIALLVGAIVMIRMAESDDRAGGMAMGIILTFATTVVASAASLFQKLLQNAVDIKREHDLTV